MPGGTNYPAGDEGIDGWLESAYEDRHQALDDDIRYLDEYDQQYGIDDDEDGEL